MKIVDVTVQNFRYISNTVRDSEGHGHPGDPHEATNSLLTITTDEGVKGYSFGASASVINSLVRPLLIGEDPMYRERIWHILRERQRLHLATLSDRALCAVDLALWDLAGRYLNQPVHKLLGAYRDKVPAYASTMCGDALPGGLSTPQEYADFAVWCVKERGYPAYKLHTWQPPYPGAPSVKRDIEACAAVREALGPDVDLMLDPFHYYSREESLELARGLEKLGYLWMEEPMGEHSMSSFVWLAEQADLLIVGPETAEGKHFARAEWIKAGAADVIRAGVWDVGGITPAMKIVHLCESFNMSLEIHGGGPGNLHVLCAMGIPGRYYERGLLHPFIDYEAVPAWLNQRDDPMDNEGFVHVSQLPGLGQDINFDYIQDNLV